MCLKLRAAKLPELTAASFRSVDASWRPDQRAEMSPRSWTRSIARLGRCLPSSGGHHRRLREQRAELFVVHLVPVLGKSGEAPALLRGLKAKPAFTVVPEKILGRGFRVNGGALHRPHPPFDAFFVDHVADCH